MPRRKQLGRHKKSILTSDPVEGVNGNATNNEILQYTCKIRIRPPLEGIKGGFTVEIWGSGKPLREFLWSEELADACVYIVENVNFSDVAGQNQKEIRNTHINIGTGKEISIKDLAFLIKEKIDFKGELVFNTGKT
jgi:GDP-L-fucose synthase